MYAHARSPIRDNSLALGGWCHHHAAVSFLREHVTTMQSFDQQQDIQLGSRYECKYLLSPMIVSEVREFIQPFMAPDRFAALRENHRYPICSLYLDSPDLLLYQQTVGGEKNRFKLRVRTYSDDASTPVFFEVKRKINNIVQKRRARVDRDDGLHFLAERLDGFGFHAIASPVSKLEYFGAHMELAGARPLIRVRYTREAYESRGGDPVRITLDTELMHCVTFKTDLSHDQGRWVSTPVDGTILEIKFTERYPSWVRDLVQVFGLRQQPVPKYVWSVDHMLLEGRESVLSVGGFTLPVRRA
jgi:hypothetical protein